MPPQTSPSYAGAAPAPAYQAAAYANPSAPPQTKSKGWIVGIAIVVAICIVVIVSIASCSSMTTKAIETMSFTGSTEASIPHDSEPKLAVISITGTIQYDGTSSSPSGLRELLNEVEDNPSVKAVVLQVDSGGGVATAGEEMSEYVSRCTKPVVVTSGATNASAAYEISSQADYIFTAKTTAIGAIGVAMQVMNLQGLYEKLGIDMQNITSADSKDSSYGTRPLTEDERAWYQHMVDQIDSDFIETVAHGRSMDIDEVKKLATGMTYTGIDAVENGLADEIGYLEEALAKASDLAGFSQTLPAYPLDVSSASSLQSLLDVVGQDHTSGQAAASALEERFGNYVNAK